MKIPKDILKARREFRAIRESKDLKALAADYLLSKKNPLFRYRRIKKEDIKKDEYLFALHSHSDGSNYDPEDMALVAAKRGYKVFAITDHNNDPKFKGEKVFYYPFYDGIYLIRGMENRCEEDGKVRRDLIVLGYDNHITSFRHLKDTVKEVKENNGIIIATSAGNECTGGFSFERLEEIINDIDAVEILNSDSGFGPFRYYDVLAKQFALKHDKAGIFANDAHTLREIGLSGFGVKKSRFTFLDDYIGVEKNPGMLFDAIRKVLREKEVTNYGGYMPTASVGYPFPLTMLFYPDKFRTLSHKHALLNPVNGEAITEL